MYVCMYVCVCVCILCVYPNYDFTTQNVAKCRASSRTVSRNITLYIIADRADKYSHRNGSIGLNSYDHYFIPQII